MSFSLIGAEYFSSHMLSAKTALIRATRRRRKRNMVKKDGAGIEN